MKRFLIYAICIGLVLLGMGAFAMYVASKPYAKSESSRLFIPADATADAIADSLTSRYGRFGTTAAVLWRLQNGNPAKAHGSYVVSKGDTPLGLSRRLKRGAQSPIKVTFNNVRTLDGLASKVSAKLEFDTPDFLAACDSVLPRMGFNTREKYPAAFLPDSYEFYWTADARTVVSTLAEVRNRYWNETRRQRAAALGLTPVGVATVASIVEEETARADERPTVARLYLNRLAYGMPLQADPTVKFAVGDFSLRRITGQHLKVESPYNTYLHVGLPPGPIRIAERSTLDAVLDAPQHKYIYMCAKPDFSGYHDFASDYGTHSRNASRYRAALNRRGIH